MALTLLTVTGGAHGWVRPDGSPASGKVTLQPVAESPGGGYIVVAAPETFSLVSGNISGQIAGNTEATSLQYVVYEDIHGVSNPLPYVVTPTGSTLDLSTAARGNSNSPIPLYVLQSTVGQPNGVATLDSTGKVPLSELTNGARPWDIAEQYAGLFDSSVLVNYPGNDPQNGIVLASGTYENYHFICSELIIPNNNTVLFNCLIETGNADFGVRLDANTGFETGRYLEYCKITAVGTAFSGAGFTARLCEVVQNGDDSARIGRSYTDETVFEMCLFHRFRPAAGAHADGVQILSFPAADVTIWGCSISMDTDPGYVLPPNTGYTGAIFYDPTDVPIGPSDPQPHRLGHVWIDQCKLVSSQNYSLVIDADGVDVRNSMLLPGTTAILSAPNNSVITGRHNVDASSKPLGDIGIWGASPGPTTLAINQDVDLSIAPTNGQVLGYNGTTKYWVPQTVSGGGGTLVVRSAYITSGVVNLANTAGTWQVVLQADNTTPFELAIPAAVGDWVEADVNGMRTGTNKVDLAVISGSTLVRFLASGTSTAASDGDTGWYDSGGSFALHGGARGFSVASGDLDTGTVRITLVTSGTGSGQLEASASDTFYWQVKNYGSHT